MASSEAMYSKVPTDGADSQRNTSSRVSKMGIALIGGSCLMFLSFLAKCGWSHKVDAISAAESTQSINLLGMPNSLRSMLKPSSLRPQVKGNQLPGPSPWKELALARLEEIQANSHCARDVSMNANGLNGVKAEMAGTNSASRTLGVRAQKSVISRMQELEAGQLPPFGFWDPAGFSSKLNPGKILFYREAELKHGRVCMLAALGFLLGENFHPLFGGNIDVPSYVAFQETPLQTFWIWVLFAIAIPEFASQIQGGIYSNPQEETFALNATIDRIPGDLGFDPLRLKPSNPVDLLNMQNKELNNGRLAMIGIAGMVAQEMVNGKKIFD